MVGYPKVRPGWMASRWVRLVLLALVGSATACSHMKGCASVPEPPGEFLYAVHAPRGAVAVAGEDLQVAAFRIDSVTGALLAAPGESAAPAATGAFKLERDPAGRWFALTGSQLGLLRMTASGALEPLPVGRLNGLASTFDSGGRFFFLMTGKGLAVHGLSERTGVDIAKPLHVEASPFLLSLATTANTSLLIGAGGHDLAAYVIQQDGRLTAGPGSPAKLPGRALQMAVHPSDQFVYVRGEFGSHTRIVAYRVTSNGSFFEVADSLLETGDNAGVFTLTPDGQHLFMVEHDRKEVQTFAIDNESGLHLRSAFALLDTGENGTLVTDAAGKFLYLSSPATAAIQGFAVDAVTGTLTTIPGSPFPAQRGAGDLATSPVPGRPIQLAVLRNPSDFPRVEAGPRFDRDRPVPVGASLEDLIAAAQDRSEKTRYLAIFAMNRHVDLAPAVPVLLKALDDEGEGVAMIAGLQLAPWALQHPGVVDNDVLGRILNGKDGRGARTDNAGLCALHALIQQGAPAAPHLARALAVHTGQFQDEAFSALISMGPSAASAVEELTTQLRNSRADWLAAHVLGRIGPSAAPAVPELFTLLHHRTPRVARAAKEALARIREPRTAE
jgi:hypothetical protein